jgi:phosphatidylserine/phosphatidylglycerophosphate/cardiolipin synthase-like enzyme
MHNKYLVLLRKGADGVARPVAVWTGGTNWTEGGIYGQLNVGHAIYDPAIAERYEAGFQVLAQDLSIDETQARNDVITPLPAPTRAGLAHGTTPLFSPQNGLGMIDLYADICRTAKVLMISAPFALHERIRNVLDSPSQGAMRFMLADKEGSFGEKGNIDRLNADPGAMAAVAKPFEGIKLTEFQKRKLDRDRMMMDEGFHHAGIHIHSKMILADPFGADPVLVTGSANFSVNSTINNDSNVLVFRGDTAVADVYVADFMRMFEHYWFRSRKDAKLEANQIFALKDTDAWSERYFTEGAREQRDRLAFLGLAT